MERCELSDLPEDQCACHIHGPVEPRREESSLRLFPAQFGGVCPACQGDINKGDYIARIDGMYVHGECV